MFTGIITDIGTVKSATSGGSRRLVVETAYDIATVEIGASIACSGVCLTVVDKGADWFAVDVSGETLSRTAGELWDQGSRLNLERALRLGDELGGHIVTGHVDAVAEVVEAVADGNSTKLTISMPAMLGPMVAVKGSVTLDGVSLTVNSVEDHGDRCLFTVNIIPHTAAQTTLAEVALGRQLNVEIDVLARYLDRMVAARAH